MLDHRPNPRKSSFFSVVKCYKLGNCEMLNVKKLFRISHFTWSVGLKQENISRGVKYEIKANSIILT